MPVGTMTSPEARTATRQGVIYSLWRKVVKADSHRMTDERTKSTIERVSLAVHVNRNLTTLLDEDPVEQ